jgi:D-glutamate N-acetyltransferase
VTTQVAKGSTSSTRTPRGAFTAPRSASASAPPAPRFLILAEAQFGPLTSKTANSCIRYTPDQVVGVIDSRRAGKTANDVLGFGGDIPIVASLEEGLRFAPTALLIGIAPQGGRLPEEWRTTIRGAIEQGMDIWSGLHTFVSDDKELRELAERRGVAIHDLRRPPKDLPVAGGRVRAVEATVLTVGADCNIGKMTAALQMRDGLEARGNRVAFAGTGQTGILIDGGGIAVDAVIADFIAGAAEKLVLESAKDADIVLVEGQGSVIHPGYSGVTLGLIHGSLPHAMVMCHQPSRTHVNNNPWVKLPPLRDLIELHEALVRHLRPAPVIAVSLNTYDLSERKAKAAIKTIERETGLPTTDPVRFDPAPVVEAIDRFHRKRKRTRSRRTANR